MLRVINPEDWFLVLIVFGSLVTFPAVLAVTARVFNVPLSRIFNKEIWIIVGQISGIAIFTLLLIQVSIDSDGLGAKLIYGRF
jgi:hypothetical protein